MLTLLRLRLGAFARLDLANDLFLFLTQARERIGLGQRRRQSLAGVLRQRPRSLSRRIRYEPPSCPKLALVGTSKTKSGCRDSVMQRSDALGWQDEALSWTTGLGSRAKRLSFSAAEV